ncbi:MAG: hypothetical protein AVDCRST_MAG85-3220 [uncultured Solirubrobacteraceae bacterium]|uniref:Uncharacterized protein n=1 Tax=uncultured Solirubrobacteraceae bacterium TaxID=1162706 RepID=A0A6J4TKQ1_9ACTN|nr:MAG: hypothetical protein AVDCRST_MAG85-3220 [uncultured Solirubrobacteraceae bacterium]
MRGIIAVAAAGLVAGLGAPGAGAAELAEYGFTFSTDRPGAAAGLSLFVVYRDPTDPEGKAPALTKAAFGLPPGTRIDTRAVPRCTATDEELRARGRDACPSASRVGQGTLVATTGTPSDPVKADVTVFNGPDQLIELVTFEGTNQTAGFDRLTVEGSTLRAHPPTTPGGPPDGKTTIREVRIALAQRGALITSAPCPDDAVWRGLGSFSFEGHPDTTVAASQACRPVAPEPPGQQHVEDDLGPVVVPRGPGPALRVRVLPRRVRSGRRTRVRVLVTGRCARGATVRIALSKATTDRAGRATLRVRIRRSAAVRVTRPGCGSARGRLVARRR